MAFAQDVLRFDLSEVSDALKGAGFSPPALHAIRCVNDLITEDERKDDADFYAELLALELALCSLEPFNQMGMHTQFVAHLA